jgi:hypothetical protein
MRADLFPSFSVTKFAQFLEKLMLVPDNMEISFEVGGVFLEEYEARFEGFADEGKPLGR